MGSLLACIYELIRVISVTTASACVSFIFVHPLQIQSTNNNILITVQTYCVKE